MALVERDPSFKIKSLLHLSLRTFTILLSFHYHTFLLKASLCCPRVNYVRYLHICKFYSIRIIKLK